MNSSELFKLKLSEEEHFSVLKTALKMSTFVDPDICLVSKEGFKIYTHRSLLCLHSQLLSKLLPAAAASSCCCTQAISVPATAVSLHTLIQLLLEGSVKLGEKKGVKLVTEAATALGIDLNLIENKFDDSEAFANNVVTFELKTKSANRAKISRIDFPASSSLPKFDETEENLMIKSEIPEDFHDVENNYSETLREPGEVLSNDYEEEFNETEFDMIETPTISNAEIRAEMKIQSPEDPNHCCYECKFCKKVFANITHLKRHLPSHTGEKPFHCELCGLKFSRKDNLLIHKRTRCVVLRTAMEGTDILHDDDITCNICGKNFLQGNDFKRHMMCHTGLKPYNCEVCGKGFIQKSRFKTHVESHNSN